MSIKNRNINQNGTYTVTKEKWYQTLIGKLHCLLFGHKVATFKTNKGCFNYCICCWKEFK